MTLRAGGTVVPVAMLTGGRVGFVSSRTLPLGTWSHVAMTYDGSMLRLYINGADAGSRAATGTMLPAPEAGILGGASAFAGTIDELRFYRRALSPAEVRIDSATPIDTEHPLEISAHTPEPNAVGVIQTAMTITFSRAVDPSTITTSTLEVLDIGNVGAPATVSYDATTRTATLSPASALTPLTPYMIRVLGGSMGVRDALGVPLAADFTSTFRTASADTAPAAVYAFSETSGVTVVDSSGNDNDGALMDGPARTTGRFGRGLRLDGVDDAVQLPITQSLTLSSAFTIEAWIAPATFGGERSLWRISGAMLTLRAEGTVVPVAVLSDEQVGFVSSSTLPLDTWSHVAMTYDGSRLRLFINGADAGSRAATGTLVPASPPEAGILGGASAFTGTIDELRLYRRALSASEIAADMTGPAAPAAPLAVTSTTPVDHAVNVAVSAAISATFSRPADAASVTTATVQLRDGNGHVVAASVTYDGAARTVTLTPTSPLAASANYYARVLGGSGGVRAEDGGELSSDVQWSFRTAAAVAPPPPVSAPPHITSLSVYSSWLGSAVLVNGNSFGRRQGGSTVTINGVQAFVVVWSSNTIVVIVPARVTAGPLVVKVDGKSSNAVTAQFHIPRRS